MGIQTARWAYHSLGCNPMRLRSMRKRRGDQLNGRETKPTQAKFEEQATGDSASIMAKRGRRRRRGGDVAGTWIPATWRGARRSGHSECAAGGACERVTDEIHAISEIVEWDSYSYSFHYYCYEFMIRESFDAFAECNFIEGEGMMPWVHIVLLHRNRWITCIQLQDARIGSLLMEQQNIKNCHPCLSEDSLESLLGFSVR